MRPNARHLCPPILIGALIAGCVYSPVDGQSVDIQDIDFRGFASNPGGTVEVEFLDHATESWQVLATAKASTGPVHYGGQTLYPWSATVDFNDVGDYLCYWGVAVSPGENATCLEWIYPLGAVARAREVGGAMAYMTTFEDDGVACVHDLVGQGDDWFAAGHKCQSNASPTLFLYGYNPPQ